MLNKISRKFALSKDGAKELVTSIFWSTLVNISYMLPSGLSLYFLNEKLNTNKNTPILNFIFSALIIIIIMFVINRFQYISTYVKTFEETERTRISLAEKIRKLPLAFFDKKDIADLSSTVMEDISIIEDLFSHTVPQLYAAVVSASLTIIALFIYNYKMSIAMFFVVPISFLCFYISRKLQKKAIEKLYYKKRNISTIVQEGIDNISEIKAYNYEDIYKENLNTSLDDYEKEIIKAELVVGSVINLSFAFLKLGLVSVLLVGAYLLSINEISVFMFIVFLILSASVYTPFISSLQNLAALMLLNQRIDRMNKINNMPIQEGSNNIEIKEYDIEFQDVYFSYEDTSTINGVSFIAKQGEITALVGPSGGGKTTLTKLAARFWDINSGKILISGKDISKIDPEHLLSNFSIVFQDVTLFNNTVFENIKIGNKEASDEQVLEAARLAQCDEFVNRLTNGYQSMIGENGQMLSGGERQRISIARAILKDAPIILLDEATSSLDADNERKIQIALSSLVKDKTVIIIAHRMRTILNADKVIVLKDGKIVQKGKPNNLLKEEGLFKEMNK